MLVPQGTRRFLCSILAYGMLLFFWGVQYSLKAADKVQIVGDIFNLRIQRAIDSASVHPDTSFRYYYSAKAYFYAWLLTEDARFGAFADQQQQYLLDRLHDSVSVRASGMSSEMLIQQSIRKIMAKQYLPAAMRLRDARNRMKEAQNLALQDPDVARIAGLFNVAFSAVPDQYKWVTSLLGFTGDLNLGVSQLTLATTSQARMPEASVILYYIFKNLLLDEAATFRYAHEFRRMFPLSPVPLLMLGTGHLDAHHVDSALFYLKKVSAFRPDPLRVYSTFTEYFTAKALLFQLRFDAAQATFKQFLFTHQGSTFKADAAFRLALALELSGSRKEALKWYQIVVNGASAGFDEDAYAIQTAQRLLQTPLTEIECTLYRARFSFDGGNLELAASQLLSLQGQLPGLGTEDKCEFYYRAGRIRHEQSRNEEALKYYTIAIGTPGIRNAWMRAYAWFYSGMLYEKQGRLELAKTAYREALKVEHSLYRVGLEQKCKAALRRLKA